MDVVSELLRELTGELVVPRFRRLAAHQVDEKEPGDAVTVVDHEMELALERRLTDLAPGSIVIGEEAVAADPERMRAITGDDVWLVDPLDGTNNFVRGSPDFATMVVRLRHGTPVAAWVYAPAHDRLTVAEAGGGTWHEGQRIIAPDTEPSEPPLGMFYTRYLPASLRRQLDAVPPDAVRRGRPSSAAGIEYPRLLTGHSDFIIYWRTLPWDHLPGALLVQEAGGRSAHFDGSPYRAGAPRKGLLVTRRALQWDDVRRRLNLEELT